MVLVREFNNEFGYVLGVATATWAVNLWHGTQTVKARKASGINYPHSYATPEQADKNPAAYRLNCAQRAHSNFTENLTPFIVTLLIAGLRFPTPAASLGAAWLLSRIVYTIGYTSGKGPQGRMLGAAGHYLTQLGLVGLAGYTAVKMVLGS